MAWFLQTPEATSPKLLAKIVEKCGPALRGGAAFAFATANGVKLLLAEPAFQNLLATGEFKVVVGLDAITDTKAVDELRKAKDKYPNFKPKLFSHNKVGTIFHPKTIWVRLPVGGCIMTGSGNLTAGGLRSNWEALAVEMLSPAEIDAAEAQWNAWLAKHADNLLDLDDAIAVEKAKANKAQRIKIKKALKLPEAEHEDAEAAAEAAEEVIEEVAQDLSLNPILIAEVPRSGNRWKQVNFDVKTYQEFFGVTLGSTKDVLFYHVNDDGSLGAPEERHAVAVQSHNYRFEVGAANGLAYPAAGHPIVIFEKITESTFNYVLLMPGQPAHTLIQDFLDDNYAQSNGKRRVTITAGVLQEVWPECPLFL
jgi:hypothetical protein